MKLATKFLFTILFGIFLQNGVEATNQMNALYQNMFVELSRKSDLVFYAQPGREPWMPVLSKLEMGRHIYAKIELLEGILAELHKKRDHMGAEREYFVDENTLEMFLDYLKKRGQKAELFSDFPHEKFENKSYYMYIWGNEWFMDELLGKKYPAEFFDILDSILAMQLVPEEVDPESGMPSKYPDFQFKLIKLITKLKLEIVVGQTHDDFNNLNGRIKRNKEQIQEQIDGGPKGFLKVLHPQRVSKSHQQKPLFLKYKQLNEVSQKLYFDLASLIPIIMRKKAKKEEAKLSEETIERASKVKNALAQVLEETSASTSRGTNAHSMGDTMLEIQRQLCLPTEWLEDQKILYGGADSEARLLSSIHMNTAMLLLAYERTAKFYD